MVTEERRANCALHSDKLEKLETGQNKILKLLQGNGEMGFMTKAGLAYDDMKERHANKNKIKFDIYRWIIFAILTFIAARVGLK